MLWTVKFIILIITLLFCNVNLFCSKIIQVASLFRHGHRYSIYNFNNTDNNFQSGELTEEGKKSSYLKGKEFRDKFSELLREDDTTQKKLKSHIRSYSSNKNRNIVSLFYKIKGIFDDNKSTKYEKYFEEGEDYMKLNPQNNTQNFTSIMVTTFATRFPDLMFNVLSKCTEQVEKTADRDHTLSHLSEKWSRFFKWNDNVFGKYLNSSFFQMDLPFYLKVFYVVDYLERNLENNITLDKDDIIAKEYLQGYSKVILDLPGKYPSLQMLFLSKFYSEILKNFDSRINNHKNKVKIVLFSGHDVNLAVMMTSLSPNDSNKYQYEFNDEINFILHEINDDYYVSIKYNDDDIDMRVICEDDIVIKENINLCEYEKFQRFADQFIVEENMLRNFCVGELTDLFKIKFNRPKEEF
jgi:hypothetical protein